MHPLQAKSSSAFQSRSAHGTLRSPKEGGCREIKPGREGGPPGRSRPRLSNDMEKPDPLSTLAHLCPFLGTAWPGRRARGWGRGQLSPGPSAVRAHIRAALPVGRAVTSREPRQRVAGRGGRRVPKTSDVARDRARGAEGRRPPSGSMWVRRGGRARGHFLCPGLGTAKGVCSLFCLRVSGLCTSLTATVRSLTLGARRGALPCGVWGPSRLHLLPR